MREHPLLLRTLRAGQTLRLPPASGASRQMQDLAGRGDAGETVWETGPGGNLKLLPGGWRAGPAKRNTAQATLYHRKTCLNSCQKERSEAPRDIYPSLGDTTSPHEDVVENNPFPLPSSQAFTAQPPLPEPSPRQRKEMAGGGFAAWPKALPPGGRGLLPNPGSSAGSPRGPQGAEGCLGRGGDADAHLLPGPGSRVGGTDSLRSVAAAGKPAAREEEPTR